MDILFSRFSRTSFLLALVCFFLPFATVSCERIEIKTFHGHHLIFGTSISVPGGNVFGKAAEEKIPGNNSIRLAAICAITGVILPVASVAITASALGSGALLYVVMSSSNFLPGDVPKEFISVDIRYGYLLTLIFLAVGGALHLEIVRNFQPLRSLLIHVEDRRRTLWKPPTQVDVKPQKPEIVANSTPQESSSQARRQFCVGCGNALASDDTYCGQCGRSTNQ